MCVVRAVCVTVCPWCVGVVERRTEKVEKTNEKEILRRIRMTTHYLEIRTPHLGYVGNTS